MVRFKFEQKIIHMYSYKQVQYIHTDTPLGNCSTVTGGVKARSHERFSLAAILGAIFTAIFAAISAPQNHACERLTNLLRFFQRFIKYNQS